MAEERRSKKFMVALSPSERAELQRLAEYERMSAADVVRRLIWRGVEQIESQQEKVYGIWYDEQKRWLILESDEVFHTTSLAAAQIQMRLRNLDTLPAGSSNWHVRQIPESPLLPIE